jgi:dienelactone hydrolase
MIRRICGRLSRVALLGALVLAAACAKGSPHAPRVVDITGADGVILKGTLFAAPTSGPAVLLLHQCDDQRKVWDALGTRLAGAGITALSVDYRGYGESGGTRYDKLSNAELAEQQATTWPVDIDSAFAFLSRQAGVKMDRAGAAGGSCGVNNAVQLARRHDNVKALALLAGGPDRDGRLFLETPAAPPVFAAAAGDDKYADFVAIMSWIFGASNRAESRLAQYPTGGHAAVIFKTHPGLADTLATWFAAVLANPTGALPTTNGVPLSPDVLAGLHGVDRPGGAAALMTHLGARASAPTDVPRLPEFFVNQLGYEHMSIKDYGTAIDLMKLNAATYPDSPNAMDSLGDVYLASGDTASAIAAAKRALVVLERDTVDTPERKATIRRSAQAKIGARPR